MEKHLKFIKEYKENVTCFIFKFSLICNKMFKHRKKSLVFHCASVFNSSQTHSVQVIISVHSNMNIYFVRGLITNHPPPALKLTEKLVPRGKTIGNY